MRSRSVSPPMIAVKLAEYRMQYLPSDISLRATAYSKLVASKR